MVLRGGGGGGGGAVALPPWLPGSPVLAVLIAAHYLSDYDAPLSEAGDYTTKYHLLRKLFSPYHSEC